MNKALLTFFGIFVTTLMVYAQVFTPHTVTTNASGARAVYSVDIDGDNDLDILSASYFDDKIAWYENDGNTNPTFMPDTISTSADGAHAVYASDLDSDGDMDVLSASYFDDKIAWYENDGNQNFTAHNISILADGADDVYATDIDSDGDIDVLSASRYIDKIAWYENDGNTNPTFTTHTITTNAIDAYGVFAADVDGDNDIDILSASYFDDKIAWYENDGNTNPTFTTHTITTNADGAKSVYAADIDGDSDIDVLSASREDDKIAWYENDGNTNPTFTAHTITTNAVYAYDVYAKDIDADNDIDILSASTYDNKIAWYENDGYTNPTFTNHNISLNANKAYAVYIADIDGDGDNDVMSASGNDNKIAWYENSIKISVNPNPIIVNYQIFPNPTSQSVTLEMDKKYTNISIAIADITGRIIKTLQTENTQKIQVQLPTSAGIYFLRVTIPNGKSSITKVIKTVF